MTLHRYHIVIALLFNVCQLFAQTGIITGVVRDEKNNPIPFASVALTGTALAAQADSDGNYSIADVPFGKYEIVAHFVGKSFDKRVIQVDTQRQVVDFKLSETVRTLEEVTIESAESYTAGRTQLNAVENFGIYEGKKTEVIKLNELTLNAATNNPRQIYSKITGLNIWESDGAGLQLGIGGRGLNPNRTSNFNVRQNGYDISADALGYPESYYTPPAEALERIEIVRGAASLQYGTQFGGLLNFQFRKGSEDKKIEFTTRQTLGSWNFFGTFNSIGGTVAKGKLNYYAYYSYKRGDGYRPNAGFDFHNAFASVRYQINPNLLIHADVTRMTYLAQQPGGLTDRQFSQNPRQSFRERNWFRVDWNLLALNLTYRFTDKTQLNIRNFGLLASRESLGNLERINVADFGNNRTLIAGDFRNFGNETRLLHRYTAFGRTQAFVTGIRIYRGTSTAKQGDGNNGTGPSFRYLNPEDLENSDYTFPNENYAAFAEHIFDLSPKFSITPGIRFEHIRTFAEGYYKQVVRDNAGNVIVSKKIDENNRRVRSLVLAGIGVSYKPSGGKEIYANFSQNYRAINFTDLRIVNPNFVIDPNIQDEKGFTADFGTRGTLGEMLRYEATLFYIKYNGKIGQVLRTDTVLFNDYRFRGNIADARNIGIEAFGELDVNKLFRSSMTPKLSLFLNASVIDARYVNSGDASVEGRDVEMVPPVLIRTGLNLRYKQFSTSLQYSYTKQHYSDASNATRTATAVEGIIPSYQVVDLTASWLYRQFSVELSFNNLLNETYFTRRAESYPGPGIIPADGRAIYVTLQWRMSK